MKKINIFVFSIIVFLLGINVVSATCTTEETNKLNSIAVNVKANYEKMQGILSEDEYSPPDGLTDEELENYVATYDFFRVYITNLTEDLYVTVYNDATGKTDTYTYQDSDNGVVSFDYTNIRIITNFRITIYSSSNTNCKDRKLYTIYITTPKYNEYSQYDLCNGNEEFYLCYEYLSVNSVEFDKFVSLLEQYEKGKIDKNGSEINDNATNSNGFIGFVKEHKTLVIGVSIGIVLIGGLVTVIIVNKRRRII